MSGNMLHPLATETKDIFTYLIMLVDIAPD